ncbi:MULTISPECIES: CvpA family protein [unclassified Beijerinckia]|uniref:CvpA family protein n=1 Tax=unclassified Beijerinckia TaxID=2638183 RepID=UPI0008980602|nr:MULTISPECIES: CvpA family protein [unclassified Beijerinckia]MDH7795748.1 membrane protein required for colicin V production [Beijerinckia sp. GAS462]SEC14507.1 membrane protein required for colicin V production [Beijerinckia sp. 28-YEA-48]
MPSYLDLGIIAVVLLSAFLAMLRGFTREVLAIASWAAAAVAAYYFYPMGLPYLKPYITKENIAIGVSAAAIFFATLVIVSIFTVKISDMILDSKIGALDRSLGFVYGAARGLLLCVVAFLFFNWLVPEKTQPEWVRTARTKPLLQATGDQLMAILPADPESAILKGLRRPGSDEPAPEGDTDSTKPPAATPAPPAPGQRTDSAPSQSDRNRIQSLITQGNPQVSGQRP